MAWEVEYTDGFEQWWNTLSEEEQISLDASVRLLEARGPYLGFPHSSAATSQGRTGKWLRSFPSCAPACHPSRVCEPKVRRKKCSPKCPLTSCGTLEDYRKKCWQRP